MPYRIEWLVEPRILMADISGVLTLGEVNEINQTVMRHLEEATIPLYGVANMTDMTDYPHIATELSEMARFYFHPMFRAVYYYGVKSPAMSVILRNMARVSPFDYLIVDSLDDALAAIVAREPALAPLVASINTTRA